MGTTCFVARSRANTSVSMRWAGICGWIWYEMAIRDHFRLDVLIRRAAVLQERDAELGEVERLLAAADEGVGGDCRSCGAPHSRGAVYCWKCGQPLMAQAASAALIEPMGNASA